MAAVIEGRDRRGAWLEWLPVVAGLLLLYVPVFYRLATTVWQTEDNTQGPVILVLTIWLLWRERHALAVAANRAMPTAGIALLVFGVLIYVFGRTQNIGSLQVAALIPMLAGAVIAMRGPPTLCALWFPLLFISFLVPLPGTAVDALTGPLKRYVSMSAEYLLYMLHYPIARRGAMLQIGQYQLLVENACAGLNSMFSLSALGLLYLYIVRRVGWVHNGLVIASLVPIAFLANVARVVTLALVTYYLGDAAGRGFLHSAAGIFLLGVALLIVFALDGGLARVSRRPVTRA